MNTYKFKQGTYYIGDLCYAIRNDWGDFLDTFITDGKQCRKVRFKNRDVFVGFTAYGDGCYKGSDERSYWVDAGLIGVCPIELADLDYIKGMDGVRLVEIDHDFNIVYDRGNFIIDNIQIKTR